MISDAAERRARYAAEAAERDAAFIAEMEEFRRDNSAMWERIIAVTERRERLDGLRGSSRKGRRYLRERARRAACRR